MYAGEGLDNHHFTAVHDIYVEDVHCERANGTAIVLQGTQAEPLHNIRFTRVNVEQATAGLSMDHTQEIDFVDCHLGGRSGAPTTASAKDKIFEK